MPVSDELETISASCRPPRLEPPAASEPLPPHYFASPRSQTNQGMGWIRGSGARDTLGWGRMTRRGSGGGSPRRRSRRSCIASSSLDGRRRNSSTHTPSAKRWESRLLHLDHRLQTHDSTIESINYHKWTCWKFPSMSKLCRSIHGGMNYTVISSIKLEC